MPEDRKLIERGDPLPFLPEGQARDATMPMSLKGALGLTATRVHAHASEVRHALAQRHPERAWANFVRVRHVLSAHLVWETDDLPALLCAPDMMDWPGGVRTLRAWHDLLMDALSDLECALTGPWTDPIRGPKAADHCASLLMALVEDYQADLERSVYRTLDDDVELHDLEQARERSLEAWARRQACRH